MLTFDEIDHFDERKWSYLTEVEPVGPAISAVAPEIVDQPCAPGVTLSLFPGGDGFDEPPANLLIEPLMVDLEADHTAVHGNQLVLNFDALPAIAIPECPAVRSGLWTRLKTRLQVALRLH